MAYRLSVRACAALALFLYVGVLFATPGFAQARVDVTGVVMDSTGTGLEGATVMLVQEADSSLVSYGITRADGMFQLRRVGAGKYLLQITFVGFASHTQPLTVGSEAVDVGEIRLKGSVAELDALVVTAERIPMVVKKDTLEYNALAFRVPPNSSVEELLKRLPGVEVEQDGTIKAQGETVRKVLVDGKEFFGNDPTIATRNLPAEAVDKVQVYDKKSDAAEFTGVDDGQEEKTINLALKEDHRQGYFGNASGAFGGTTPPGGANPLDGSARYEGRAMINRFSPGTQMSVIANINNVNQQGFSPQDYFSFMGGMQAMAGGGFQVTLNGSGIPIGNSLSDGFATTRSGGLNFNHDFSAKTSLRSSYFINQLQHDQQRDILQQQIFGESITSRMQQYGTQLSQNFNNRLNLDLMHKFSEGHDVRLRSNFQASWSDLDNTNDRATRRADGVLQNASSTTYNADNRSLSGQADLTYRLRLGGGRSLVAEFRSGLNDGDQDGDLAALNTFYQEGNVLTVEEIAQLQSQYTNSFNHSEKVSFTQPLGKRRFLQFDAEHRSVSEEQNKEVFDRVSDNLLRNDELSSAFERTYTYNKAGVRFRSNQEKLSLGFGLDVQQSDLEGQVLDLNSPIDNGFFHFLPSASLNYAFSNSKQFHMQYNASTREPSVRDLQPVVDNSDPLNIYIGNPDLQPEYTHNANVRFMLFDPFTFTNLFVFANASYTLNKIARARTIDEQFRQTVTPFNTDGDWRLMGNVSFGTPIRPLGAKIDLSTNTMYDRNREFINGEENASQILRSTMSVRLENRNKEHFDVGAGARYTFNVVSYSLNEQLNQDYVNRTFFGSFAYTLGPWRFATSLDYNLYSKEVSGTGRSVPLWKAEISRSLLDNRARLELVALDLLDKNVGLRYNNTNTYIQEERINTLGRYVLLRFVYNLRGMGNQGAGGIRISTAGG